MGPQHPSTHGVLRVILKLDGEKVNGIECVIGYLHRGIEKLAENRTWIQFGPFVDRLDYTAAVSNSLGYCLAVEKLLGVEMPKRAQYLRVILTELCRLASHQIWLGTHVLDIGAVTPLFYAFRDREDILNVFEKYCGARLTTHAFRIGGCRWDAYEGFAKEVLHICDDLGPKIDEYKDLITGNRIWLQRTKNVGYISPEDCLAYGLTGPLLRGSGVELGSAQGAALLVLRRFRLRDSDRRGRRHLRPLHRPHRRNAPVDPHHPSGGGRIAGRPHHCQGAQGHQASGGRGLRQHRGAQGRTRLLRGQRRHAPSPIASACARHRSSTCRRWRRWQREVWWPTWWPS